MRTFLTAVSVLLLAAPAGAATRNFGVTSFEKIRVEGPFTVTLATGVAPFARASGSQTALDRLAIEVRGDTLVVHNSVDSWSADTAPDAGQVEISLGTHDLSAAWLNGSGALNIDRVKGLSFNLSVQGSGAAAIGQVDVDQLSVGIAGTGGASLSGHTGKMTAVVRGISSLDATKLAAKDATVGAEGSATVKAYVSNSVRVDASGPATIRLDGKPACTVRASGSASVTGCRSSQ